MTHHNEQQLSDHIKVWTDDENETVIHHRVGFSIAMDWNTEVALFRWLQADLARRGEFGKQEEQLPADYSLQVEDGDTFYVLYQGQLTGYDFASEGAARAFCWKWYSEGCIPLKSEETI